MTYAFTLLQQVLVMFLLAGIGFLMYRFKKISDEGSKALGNLLVYCSLPCVIVNGLITERTPEKLIGFGISALCAAAVLLCAVLISRLVLGRHAIDNFAGSFSNPGFFGVPLITAILPEGSVFFIAAYIALLNLSQWTYGVTLLQQSGPDGLIPARGEKKGRSGFSVSAILKKLFTAPFMIAILIGMFLFLTQLQLPVVITRCVTFTANLNTPLAMFTVGIYLAQADLKGMFLKKRLYLVTLVRMVLCPAAAILLLSLVPAAYADLRMAVLIAAACPVGSNIAVYAQLHDRDYRYAVETVIISTLLSIVTMPLIVILAQFLWG